MDRGAWRAAVHGVTEGDVTDGLSTVSLRGREKRREEARGALTL